jgi:hypothetical protein
MNPLYRSLKHGAALAIALLFLPLAAKADGHSDIPDQAASPDLMAGDQAGQASADTDAPWVERSFKRFYCVEYARLRSGLAIFGDARLWWDRAKDLYAEIAQPAVDTVMVFSGSKRIRKGHVAVVTEILSRREIIVDHANWQNHGEIDHHTPVLDVSADNDWSRVRVWDIRSHGFGTHVYAVSGFIAPAAAAAGM